MIDCYANCACVIAYDQPILNEDENNGKADDD